MVAANEKNQKIQEPPEPIKTNWGQKIPLVRGISTQAQN